MLRLCRFLSAPANLTSKSLGLVSGRGSIKGPLSPGRNSTALSLVWAPHRGSDNGGGGGPLLSLMVPPAFL